MLSFTEVCKSFGQRRVLDELTLEVGKGEVYGLLGPNGAGKTTAINILCGLLEADEGTVSVDGAPVDNSTRAAIGVVPQDLSIYQDLTCRQNLRFFGQVFGERRGPTEKRIGKLSDAFGFGPYLDTPVAHLSGGWKRRVNMAVALMHSPKLLVLDEPTVGVDVEARYELWQLIERLQSEDVTILLTTHHLEEAEALCRRIGILDGGRLAAEGSLEQLRTLVPGEQLLVIESDATEATAARGVAAGWTRRDYRGKRVFLLPARTTIPEAVKVLEGIPLTSLALEEVGLEHVYLEVTRQARLRPEDGGPENRRSSSS